MNQMSGFCAAAALALGLGVSAPAHAEDQKFVGTAGWVGLVKNYELEKGHFYSSGEFRNNTSAPRARAVSLTEPAADALR